MRLCIYEGPHQLLDYDNRWKKELNNIEPYVIPAVAAELIDKMEVQLEDFPNHIGNTYVNGDQTVKHPQGLIK